MILVNPFTVPSPLRRLALWLRRPRSLRWKISVLLAAGCALVAGVLGSVIHHARHVQVAHAARESALDRLGHAQQLYELAGKPEGDANSGLDCPWLPDVLRAAVASGGRNTYVDLTGPQPTVWAARAVGEQVLVVRLSLVSQRKELDELDYDLLTAGTVVVALAAVGGIGLAGRLSRQLRTAAATARRISRGDLDARIHSGTATTDPAVDEGAHPRSDEIADLATAVNTMAASLQERIEAEKRFTADVAHELRTPLTGLQMAAELLPPGRPTELVMDRVAALRTLTEDLLEVARLDAHAEQADLDVHQLRPLVDGIAQRDGRVVTVHGGGGLVQTDARRLERIISNLLTNAHRHGAAPVEIHVNKNSVSVRDHGSGFPEHLLHNGPQRFVTGTPERGQGTGIGLTIATGQAQVINAELSFSNASERGAIATVTLPAMPADS